jgi:hypothetical protein
MNLGVIQFEKLKGLPRAQFDEAVMRLAGPCFDGARLPSPVHAARRRPLSRQHRPGSDRRRIPRTHQGAAHARNAHHQCAGALGRKSVALDAIVATKYDAGGAITRQRPICPYPQVAVYRGSGDVNAATSFTCSTSAAD